jgi:hypothetical protein
LSRANETASPGTNTETPETVQTKYNFPTPNSFQRGIIREMVANTLKERNDPQPIELAPLYFNVQEDGVSVADINPFLIAVEFALQGRTIIIVGSGSHPNFGDPYSVGHIQKVMQLMHKMGVPEERIAVSQIAKTCTQTSTTDLNLDLSQGVYFTAR